MSRSFDDLLRQAVAHHQSGRFTEAKPLYEQVLAQDPNNPNALNLLGMIHHHHADHARAAELVSAAVNNAPAIPGFHNNLGNIRLAQRRHEDAEAQYRRAIELDPKYVEAINNLGVALMGQGKIDESMPLFARAIELRHNYASARNNLGNAFRAKGMHREAVACYRDAIAFNDQQHEAWGNMGIALLEMKSLAEAEAACRRAIALRPDAVGAYYTLGLALDELGRTEEAVAQIREVVRMRPASQGLRFYLAALTGEEEFAAAPTEFVTALFDNYADTFERHLLGSFNYRAPQLLLDAVTRAGLRGPLDIADLGCGTGLCGELFKPMARTLVGVDLSPRMINQARQRTGVYDALFVDELVAFLSVRFDQFDLAIASDVLNYFGDLSAVLTAAGQAIRAGGTLAFTLEKQEGEAGYVLNRTRRYAHSIGYVRSLIAASNWMEVTAAEEVLRTEGGRDVAGWVITLRKLSS